MAKLALLAIGIIFMQANAIRVEDESEGLDSERSGLSLADVKSEMSRLKTALGNAINAYGRSQTKENFETLMTAIGEAGALLSQNQAQILQLQNNLIETFDAHAKTNSELAAMKGQLEQANAALKEEARKQQQATAQRKAAVGNLKSELSGVMTELSKVVQREVETPSVNDVNRIVKEADLAEKTLSASLSKAQSVQTGIVAKAEAMKSQEGTVADHQQALALGSSKQAELKQLAATLKTLNVDAQFLEDAGAIHMDLVNANNALERTKCPWGQFSADGNGFTGCTPCESMKEQLVEDNFGDIKSHFRIVSFFTSRKTLSALYDALTYTSEPGAHSYQQCVPKLCCCDDEDCGLIQPSGLSQKFACPAFVPTEDKAQCDETTLTVSSPQDLRA